MALPRFNPVFKIPDEDCPLRDAMIKAMRLGEELHKQLTRAEWTDVIRSFTRGLDGRGGA